MSEQVTCFYHANCIDGLASAWLVKKHYPQARLIGMDYKNPPSEYPTGLVFMVDYTVANKHQMEDLIEHSDRFIHLDHHLGVQDLILELKELYPTDRYQAIFDLEQSGAGLTWSYFYPGQSKPCLIQLVEDRDLFTLQYPSTNGFHSGIRYYGYNDSDLGFNLEVFDKCLNNAVFFNQVIRTGTGLLKINHDRHLRQIQSTYQVIEVDVPRTINPSGQLCIPFTQVVQPEDSTDQTQLMIQKNLFLIHQSMPLVAAFYDDPDDDALKVRLTTFEPYDILPIAKYYGGGGHPRASGFHLKKSHPLAKELLAGVE